MNSSDEAKSNTRRVSSVMLKAKQVQEEIERKKVENSKLTFVDAIPSAKSSRNYEATGSK